MNDTVNYQPSSGSCLVDTNIPGDRASSTATQTFRPLFVLSVVRSGSSLLYALLNQHSQIALLYEGDLPTMELFLWREFGSGGWRERWEFWNQGPSRNGIAIEELPAKVSDVWEAARVAYQIVAHRKQAKIGGEKSPHWCDCALRVAKEFPDARFIFLWRDLHGVMESIARAAKVPAFDRVLKKPAKVLLGTEKLRQACDALKVQGRLVHEVNYEDLVSRTSECMQEICQFLDVSFEDQITSLKGADRSAIFSGEHHTLVRSDRIVSSQRKQSEVLSPATRAKIDRYICRWKQRYRGKWPTFPAAQPEDTRPRSFIELWQDRITDRIQRFWDKVVIVILHQIRPRVYPKRYTRSPVIAS